MQVLKCLFKLHMLLLIDRRSRTVTNMLDLLWVELLTAILNLSIGRVAMPDLVLSPNWFSDPFVDLASIPLLLLTKARP